MSDLINRKDAIDVIMKYDKRIPTYAIVCKDALMQLTSVEPETKLIAEVKMSKEDIQDAVDEAVEKIRAEMEQPEIIRCKDCKYYIPYEWMFDGLTRSSNKDDYAPDEIGCSVNDHNYPPCGFCSFAERREDE